MSCVLSVGSERKKEYLQTTNLNVREHEISQTWFTAIGLSFDY